MKKLGLLLMFLMVATLFATSVNAITLPKDTVIVSVKTVPIDTASIDANGSTKDYTLTYDATNPQLPKIYCSSVIPSDWVITAIKVTSNVDGNAAIYFSNGQNIISRIITITNGSCILNSSYFGWNAIIADLPDFAIYKNAVNITSFKIIGTKPVINYTVNKSFNWVDTLSKYQNLKFLPFVINNDTLYKTGTYTFNLKSVSGGDSIITASVIGFENTGVKNVTIDLPSGESYTMPNGEKISTAGTYTDTVKFYIPQDISKLYPFDSVYVVTVTIVTAINNVNTANLLKVFPNPCLNQLYVSGVTNKAVSIFDLNGRAVITQVLKNDEPIDVSGLKSGLYVVRVGKFTSKVLKE